MKLTALITLISLRLEKLEEGLLKGKIAMSKYHHKDLLCVNLIML